MEDSQKCPKCGGKLEMGNSIGSYDGLTMLKKGDFLGDKIIPFYCTNCGHIEVYNMRFMRNPNSNQTPH